MSTFRRHLMMQKKCGVELLNYVQTTRGYYKQGAIILTDYTPKLNTRIVLDIEFIEQNSGGVNDIFALEEGSIYRFFPNANNYYFDNFSSRLISSGQEFRNNERCTLEVGNYYIKLNGITIASRTALSIGETDKKLCFGGSVNIPSHGRQEKIYSCLIYEDDAIVRNYAPAINSDIGKATLYDFVNKKFAEVSGVGDLIYN